MIKVENIEVWGFEHAVRGMRNPMNSWDKSDSEYRDVYKPSRDGTCSVFDGRRYVIGKNDLDLMRRLYKAGNEHRKYLRHIKVALDITAPFYWWKDFSTYKFVENDNDGMRIDTNSCSTMHKIHAKEFTLDDFSVEHMDGNDIMLDIIEWLNYFRHEFNRTKDKEMWYRMIQLLPSSYNQKRTMDMTYETVVSIIRQRSGHKLDEWNDLVDILKGLPYIREITEGTE